MSFAEQQYRAHLERQRRLGKFAPVAAPVPKEAPEPLQPVLPEAPALQSEPAVASPSQATMIETLRREIAQLSAKLEAIVREDDTPLVVPSRLKPIIRAVAKHYDVPLGDLVSCRRTRGIVRPRHVAMYLAKELTGHTFPMIGRAFAREHSTVVHAYGQIAALRLQDPKLDAEIRQLTMLLAAHEQAHD
jgi:hypothetical protein